MLQQRTSFVDWNRPNDQLLLIMRDHWKLFDCNGYLFYVIKLLEQIISIKIDQTYVRGLEISKPMLRASSVARLTKRLTFRSIWVGYTIYQRFNLISSTLYKRKLRPHSRSQLPCCTLNKNGKKKN